MQFTIKKSTLIYWSGATLILTVGLLSWLFFFRFEKYTDDAYVEGNQVVITPLREGFVTSIHTDDTFLVKKGQLLVELNADDAKLALDTARENLAKVVREVCQIYHQVFAYQADININRAQLVKATQDFEHRNDVIRVGGVSLENFEHAEAALKSNYFALKLITSLYQKEMAMVQGRSIKTHPLVLKAADIFREAWIQLYRTKIYAPVEGLIAQRRVQVGMWLQSGEPLMNIIPLNQIWVNANFKETQMANMRIGQRVKLTSDLYGSDVTFNGKIVGLPGGAGNAFSILPPQNLSGNWIKIVQRLPVRVALDPDETKHYPLRIGLSMEATVDIRDTKGELVPDSTEGPHYETPVYSTEELGIEKLIDEVIEANIDPTLTAFTEIPLDFDQLEDAE